MPQKKTIIKKVQPKVKAEASKLASATRKDQNNEEIQNFVESFGPAVGKISIYRRDRIGRYAYAGSLAPGAVSESRIQEIYGGGEFTIRLLDEGGRFLKQCSVVIEQPKREPTSIAALGSEGQRMQVEMLDLQLARQHEMLLEMIKAFQVTKRD